MYEEFNEKIARIGVAKSAIKQSLIDKGLTVSDNIEDYADIIKSIEMGSGSGDVKLFATVEDMQSDISAKENDLAVVYKEDIQNISYDTVFDKVVLPKTVVLDEAINDYIQLYFRPIDDTVMFDCWGQFDSNYFMMDCYSDTSSITIYYESSDGITYNRVGDQETVNFGTKISYAAGEEYWNDAIGKFLICGGMYFEGFYKYTTYRDSTRLETFDNIKINDSGEIEYNIGEVNRENIKTAYNLIIPHLVNSSVSMQGGLAEIISDTEFNIWLYASSTSSNLTYYPAYLYTPYKYDGSKNLYIATVGGLSSYTKYMKKFNVKLNNSSVTEQTITLITKTDANGNTWKYCDYVIPNTSRFVAFSPAWYGREQIINSYTATSSIGEMAAFELNFVLDYRYEHAPSQLNLNKANQLLPDVTAYGKNNILTGDGSIWDLIPAEIIQSKMTNIQTDILEAKTNGSINLKYGEMLWKTPADKHLELSPVIPVNSGILKDAFAAASIDVTNKTKAMTDVAVFVGGYIGQTKQKHILIYDDLFAVYDCTKGTWIAGKTSDGSKPTSYTYPIYTNNYLYYMVSTSTSGTFKVNRMDLATGTVLNSLQLPQWELDYSGFYAGEMMLSHNENFMYLSDTYEHRGCIDFVNNKYTSFSDLSGVYCTCMLLSVPNSDNAIELQVTNSSGNKKFILKKISPTGSVLKTYTTNDFANAINNAAQQHYFVAYSDTEINVIGTSNDYQTWSIVYDVKNDSIKGVANSAYSNSTGFMNKVVEYTSSTDFIGFSGIPNVYKITADYSTGALTRVNLEEKRPIYRRLGKVNGEYIKPTILLEGYALLLQAQADNSSHLAVLNYENKFNDIILDAGPITQEEYDEINATAEYVLGGVE